MATGELLWTYGNGNTAGNTTNTGSDTPWGNYPTHIAAFANGIVYTMSGEHSPNTPLYLGYRARAINATTGAELWTLLDWSASGLGTSNAPVAIADGYYTFVNAYDGQIYALRQRPKQNHSRHPKRRHPARQQRPNPRLSLSTSPQAQNKTSKQHASQTVFQQSLKRVKLHGWNTSTNSNHAQPTQPV